MTSHIEHRARSGLWLAAGVVVGVAVTAGVAIWASALLDGETASPSGPPRFVEVLDSGLEHTYQGESQYFVGGGVAVFDCNTDGMPDLYFAGGSGPATLFENQSQVGGSLRFTEAPEASVALESVTGAYPIDMDSDGLTDLAVLRVGENVMFRGLGECRFERANELWGIDGGADWTAAFSAKWVDGSELPTFVFGNYLELGEGEGEAGGETSCSSHALFVPVQGRYEAPSRLQPGWCTLSVLFSDWSRTGVRDLRVTNDRHYYRDGEEQLWRIQPGSSPSLYTREDGWQKMEIWGMGIASQDITGDGYPEFYLTSQGDNKLQTLSSDGGSPHYVDIALPSGANAHRPFEGDVNLPSTAWHAEFDDVNNDGLMDIFVSKGNVEAMSEFAADDPNNLLLGQGDGTFLEAGGEAGLLDFARSRGAAVVDLNLDGWLDIVVVERQEPVKVWRNLGIDDQPGGDPTGNWAAIKLVQPGPNPDAIGAWVQVRTDREIIDREVTIGGGHAGGQLGWVHFGLGPADAAEVRVIWPDGQSDGWVDIHTNRFSVVVRGQAEASSWVPLAD